MAHFAKINEENKVLTILYIEDANCLDENGNESELVGQTYLEKHNNWSKNLWIKTSYNTKNNKYYNSDLSEGDQSKAFRGNYAEIGGTWDNENQIFWGKQPYPSWVKNYTNASWESPIGNEPAYTEEQDNQVALGTHDWVYLWNEEDQSWDLIDTKAQ